MKQGIMLALVLLLEFGFLKPGTMAQTDSLKLQQTEQIISPDRAPDSYLEPEPKRQRNKNEKIVFVSCLLIVLTTILLYNVRSK